ncbi:MAG TPA: CoA protein activase [Bacillota bacterium]|nr:CoA protein activase [Bacillota bacterium]
MKLTFARLGNSHIAGKALLEALGIDVVLPPPPTKRTMSLGSLHSPEFACLPLKVNIGNYLEALEKGADTIVMVGGIGPCRLGLYGEVQRQILEGLGYDFKMIVVEPPQGRLDHVIRQLREITGAQPVTQYIRAGHIGWSKLTAIDALEKLALELRPFEESRGCVSSALEAALKCIDEADSPKAVAFALENGKEAMKSVCRKTDSKKPRIGIVGEVFMVLEPFVNCEIEKCLGEMGVLVYRSIYLSDWIVEHVVKDAFRIFRKSKLPYELAKPYLCHFVGGHGVETIASTVDYARQGLDGVIQVAPFTCMPEIIAQDLLPTVSRDLGIPVMTLVFDEHSSGTGVLTRLEAFIDLVQMSRRARR